MAPQRCKNAIFLGNGAFCVHRRGIEPDRFLHRGVEYANLQMLNAKRAFRRRRPEFQRFSLVDQAGSSNAKRKRCAPAMKANAKQTQRDPSRRKGPANSRLVLMPSRLACRLIAHGFLSRINSPGTKPSAPYVRQGRAQKGPSDWKGPAFAIHP